MQLNDKIFVAGHRGLVGSALVRTLKKHNYTNLILQSHSELDLENQKAVHDFFITEKLDHVFLAAAKVGGIHANNTYRAEFIYNNLIIQSNIIHAAWKSKVKRLMFFGSSCIYPKNCPQPIREEFLLTSSLEPTNEPYAIAKIAGLKMCEAYNYQYGTNFLSIIPTNLYGPHDNFNLETSHVLPALLHKFHLAKKQNIREVTLWGSGNPKREFLYVDDMAEACIYLMKHQQVKNIVNVGTGQEVSILELAKIIANVVGFKGNFFFDTSKPDGTPRKLLDLTQLHKLGWHATTSLEEGIYKTYQWLVDSLKD